MILEPTTTDEIVLVPSHLTCHLKELQYKVKVIFYCTCSRTAARALVTPLSVGLAVLRTDDGADPSAPRHGELIVSREYSEPHEHFVNTPQWPFFVAFLRTDDGADSSVPRHGAKWKRLRRRRYRWWRGRARGSQRGIPNPTANSDSAGPRPTRGKGCLRLPEACASGFEDSGLGFGSLTGQPQADYVHRPRPPQVQVHIQRAEAAPACERGSLAF